jgi:hypothetical protein
MASGPANIPEFGTVKQPDGSKGLFARDAYQHVRRNAYPAVLLTTGANDPRVASGGEDDGVRRPVENRCSCASITMPGTGWGRQNRSAIPNWPMRWHFCFGSLDRQASSRRSEKLHVCILRIRAIFVESRASGGPQPPEVLLLFRRVRLGLPRGRAHNPSGSPNPESPHLIFARRPLRPGGGTN